jgi:hypothetical protein
MANNPDESVFTVPPPAPAERPARVPWTARPMAGIKLLAAAIVLWIAWSIYCNIHVSLMNQVKWPTLPASTTGLVVLGLQDKDRPGWKHRFEARESNRSWQIRYSEEDDGGGSGVEDPDAPGARDRGENNPGATRRLNAGSVVPMKVLMKECPVVMAGNNFTGASLQEKYEEFRQVPYYAIHLNLSDEGASRFWQYSNVHNGERVAFILNNEVVTCPRIPDMYLTSFTIDPIWVKEDAQKLVDFINSQSKR